MMKTFDNVLIQKDAVGVAKPCLAALPPMEFIYGKSAGYDAEGAKEVTMSWQFHNQTRSKRARKDFRSLNKQCISNALHTSQQFYKYRKQADARLKVSQGKTQLEILLPEEQFRYGIRNRPSTPIERVVSNDYQREKLVKVEELYRARATQVPTASLTPGQHQTQPPAEDQQNGVLDRDAREEQAVEDEPAAPPAKII